MLARHSPLAHAPAAATAHQPRPARFVASAPPQPRCNAADAAPRGSAVVCAAKAKRERAAAKSADVQVMTKERPPTTPEAAPEAPPEVPEAAPQQPPPAGADAPAMSGMEMLDDEENKASGQGSSSGISSGLRMENVSMAFKNQQVLKDISWEVKKGERVGLVGVNGAGKTTQLQIIMGKLAPDGGNVVKAKKNMKIAYLAQEFDVDLGRTVREEFYSVYEKQMQVVRRQEVISKELETCGDDMDKMQKLIDEMEKLNRRVVDLDVALLDKKIDKMMPELGFTADDNDRKVRSFSGGWQMRMCLGKMLLQEPDVLLLDEPTNHLDLDAIEWLEKYLKQQEVPMVVVSHDREFLDQLCTKVVETERGVTTTYKGNYTQYVAAKSEATALQWAAWEKQQKEVTKHRELIARLSGGAQSGRAAQAEKALEKLKEEGLIEKPFVPKKRSFTFPPVERMGQKVLTIRGLTHGYETRPLFRNVSLDIEKGDRVAIIGPNGAGKSTLLRLIMGTEQPNEGEVSLGEHNIAPNYFEQNQAEALDLKLTVLETLVRASPEAQLNDLKNLLGRMMFSGTGMEKKVGVLSGGEKARLALAKFMCTEGTLLVLDEPTNHLDIPSKEMLEEAITQFEGAVIAVSHDRYFLRRIATRVLTVENQTLTDFQGDYDYYLEQNQDEAAVMDEKAARQKQLQQENTKATSKMTKAERTMLKKQKAKEFNEATAGKGRNAKGKK